MVFCYLASCFLHGTKKMLIEKQTEKLSIIRMLRGTINSF